MRLIILLLTLLLIISRTARAQTTPETPVSYTLDFFAQGVNPATGSPVLTNSYPLSAVSCNQPATPTPTGTIVNPTAAAFADPVNAGKDCIINLNQATTIFAIPIGNYFATLKAVGATLTSSRSNNSNPFAHQVVPAAPGVPLNLRIF